MRSVQVLVMMVLSASMCLGCQESPASEFAGVVSEMAGVAREAHAPESDCAAQRDALSRYVADNDARFKALGEDLRAAEGRTSEEDKQRLSASFRALERALEPCRENGVVVWEAIEGPMGIAIEKP